MPKAIFAASGFLALALIAGCDDPAQSSRPTTKPTVAVATTEPTGATAVVAAYPQRPPSTLSIDGRDVAFPAAKLALISHGTGGFTLRLCTDDPPNAIDPGYTGNSYVLDMQLAMDRLTDLPVASWDHKPTDGDDSASGIYLHGCREQYRPRDVHVTFAKNGDELLVYVTGAFLHSDEANPNVPPDRVQVSGCLRTNLPAE